MKLEHITKFRPAFHKVHEDPAKNYGVGSMEVFMVVKGKKGAVHFIFMTGMYLPETYKWWQDTGKRSLADQMSHNGYPLGQMGVDVGYHSPVAQYEEQKVMHPTKIIKTGDNPLDIKFKKIGKKPPVCEYIGVPCFTDGSALRAEKWFDILMREGGDKIWQMLEEEYKERFDSK